MGNQNGFRPIWTIICGISQLIRCLLCEYQRSDIVAEEGTSVFPMREYNKFEPACDLETAQRDFLQHLLDNLTNRRTAVDTRATLICTLGLALFGFVCTQNVQIFDGLSHFAIQVITALILIPTFASIAYSLSLIAPLRSSRKVRSQNQRSITFFYLIPRYSLQEYQDLIHNLSGAELVDFTAKQVYEISKLLKTRYDRLILACSYLEKAIILFFLCILGKYIWLIIHYK